MYVSKKTFGFEAVLARNARATSHLVGQADRHAWHQEGNAMNRSLIMKTLAVVSAAFGLVFLFWPNGLMAVYGADSLNGPGVYNSMLYGGCLLALAVVNWTASDSGAAEARHVVLGTLVANTLGFFTALVRQVIDQTVPPTAWLNVLIFLVFAILFGYLQFAPEPSSRPASGSAP
jgi:hypothetical protein